MLQSPRQSESEPFDINLIGSDHRSEPITYSVYGWLISESRSGPIIDHSKIGLGFQLWKVLVALPTWLWNIG